MEFSGKFSGKLTKFTGLLLKKTVLRPYVHDVLTVTIFKLASSKNCLSRPIKKNQVFSHQNLSRISNGLRNAIVNCG